MMKKSIFRTFQYFLTVHTYISTMRFIPECQLLPLPPTLTLRMNFTVLSEFGSIEQRTISIEIHPFRSVKHQKAVKPKIFTKNGSRRVPFIGDSRFVRRSQRLRCWYVFFPVSIFSIKLRISEFFSRPNRKLRRFSIERRYFRSGWTDFIELGRRSLGRDGHKRFMRSPVRFIEHRVSFFGRFW